MATGTWMNNIFKQLGTILGGTPERLQQVPRFTEQQQDIFSQLQQGTGGALPEVFQQLLAMLTQDPQAAQQFEAPAIRQYEEQFLPSIAERFTGLLGEGAQRSSAFGQQLAHGTTALTERLSKQRGERSNQAMNQFLQMMKLGQTPQQDTLLRPRQPGLLETGAKGAIKAAPYLISGGI